VEQRPARGQGPTAEWERSHMLAAALTRRQGAYGPGFPGTRCQARRVAVLLISGQALGSGHERAG